MYVETKNLVFLQKLNNPIIDNKMGKGKLKGRDLVKIGYTQGRVIGISLNVMKQHFKAKSKAVKLDLLSAVLKDPNAYVQNVALGSIAKELLHQKETKQTKSQIDLRQNHVPFQVFGKKNIEKGALDQMYTAAKLPITVAAALMPDAHQGYGLPIGGVLATQNTVILYGVGVDIGCRMCLTVYGMPTTMIKGSHKQFKKALMDHTRFGAGCTFKNPIDDAIFEREEFAEIPFVRGLKDTAFAQIGTSGGGNHFVEFGIVDITDPSNEMGLAVGQYVGILSHSGSRGLGAKIANYYTKIAMQRCHLPKEAKHLAWLELDSAAGAEYWSAMNLAGDYASACHHQIHKRLSKAIGEKPLAMVENHHNFAWKESLADGTEVIVHRKGATPAGKGVLGIIPGSMTAPGFIVRGKGIASALSSAAHGAGRQLSRRKAKETLTKKAVRELLKKNGVTLIGGGLDEAPMAYKNIHEVMHFQRELVDVLGSFSPKIVRMAGA